MFRLPKFPLNRAYSAGIAKVRHAAPAFKTQAVLPSLKFGEISLSEYKEKSWVCLFFYPLDCKPTNYVLIHLWLYSYVCLSD